MKPCTQLLAVLCLLWGTAATAQSYTSYFTGDTANTSPQPVPGICLMGGATESDPAMRWFLSRATGGDVVVLRASGADGYNDYMYAQLGVSVNSVETIVFNNAAAAADPYVRRRIAEAEAVWLAGGDQWNYVQYWRGTGIDSLINNAVNARGVPIGGTSAGMAILGEAYNSAQNGSALSSEALADPFNPDITIGNNDFLHLPWMQHVITDTHYDNPDRRPRHFVFLSRLMGSSGDTARGIACDEYTAVCVDAAGLARVFGNDPTAPEVDQAYFLQATCALPNNPEVLIPGQPITWNRNGAAVKVYHVIADTGGTHTFSLADWKTGSGGFWEDWSTVSGSFMMAVNAQAPQCATGVAAAQPAAQAITIFQDGTGVQLRSPEPGTASIADAAGRVVYTGPVHAGSNPLPIAALPSGLYFIRAIFSNGATQTLRWAKL